MTTPAGDGTRRAGRLALAAALLLTTWAALQLFPPSPKSPPLSSSAANPQNVGEGPDHPAEHHPAEHHPAEHRLDPSRPRDPSQEAEHPHPITPLHQQFAHSHELINAAIAALRDRDLVAARRFLREAADAARTSEPSASFESEIRGYELIVDCLEARTATVPEPGAQSPTLRARAEAYLAEQRLAPRRQVRRVCLEGRSFGRSE